MPKLDPVAVRLEPEIKAALQAAADADRRPLASLLAKILTEWVEAQAKPGRGP